MTGGFDGLTCGVNSQLIAFFPSTEFLDLHGNFMTLVPLVAVKLSFKSHSLIRSGVTVSLVVSI